ncbi:hypothetical protein CVT26_008230 [Gymnopilus dilepis]|uniref:F-box domain-containing protein n=1 Tax=Gymnopilus dilepis TaxID=231916 RepID=A0A409XXD1_9AGAR|nr:hypothetical protein CVT26_008230 [Gymnopilus dilepis]
MGIGNALPPELVRIIVEDASADRAALHALASTSRLFNAEATRLLYASMTDSEGTTHYKFLRKIQNNLELARLVRIYHLPANQNTQRGSLGRLLARCLPLMVNLEELAVPKIIWEDGIFPPQIVKKCPFYLKRFVWIPFSDDHGDARRFLECESNLTHLYWGPRDVPSLNEGALPNLISLGANAEVANQILHAQAITTFHYRLFRDSYYINFPSERQYAGDPELIASLLQREIPSLRTLSFDVVPTFILQPFREVELKFFRHVQVLYLLEARLQNFVNMAPYLRKFPALKELIATPQLPLTVARSAAIDSDVLQLFKVNPSLKQVSVLWENPRLYKQWILGCPQDQLVQLSEDWIFERPRPEEDIYFY